MPSKSKCSTEDSSVKQQASTREVSAQLKLNGVPLATVQLKKLNAGYSYSLIRELVPLCTVSRNKSVKITLGSLRHIESFARALPKIIDKLCDEGLYDDAAYILDSVAALVDEFAKWDTKLDMSNVEFVSSILHNFSFAHVVRWEIQAGSTTAYMYGTIDHLEPRELKLFMNFWVRTPQGDFMERLLIGNRRHSESQAIDLKHFHKDTQKTACKAWKICRWSEVESDIRNDLRKLETTYNFRLRLKQGSGVFDIAPQTLGTRNGSNRLSGIWAESFVSMDDSLLVEDTDGVGVERSQPGGSIYSAAQRVELQGMFSLAPFTVKTMAVSAISQDRCERYYVHLSCADVVRSAKRPDIVVRGDIKYWMNQAVNMYNKSTVRLLVLAGPPGFGKTKLAEMFAADLAKNFLRVSVGVVGLDLVQLASRLSIISRLAEALNACVIIDDADFLLSARVDDTYRYGLFQSVVEFIDRSRVPIVCTTNLSELDEAIVLRADHGIWVDWDSYLNDDEKKQSGDRMKSINGRNEILAEMLFNALQAEFKSLDVSPSAVIETLRRDGSRLFELSPREVSKVITNALRISGAELATSKSAANVAEKLADAIDAWSNRWQQFRLSINNNSRGEE